MAEKKRKSQAQKAASAGNSKSGKSASAKKPAKKGSDAGHGIPTRLTLAAVYLCVAAVFLVIYLKPEGTFIKLLEAVIHGLIGRVAFVVSIPVLLYLFVIYAFMRKRSVKMQTFCLLAFVLISGSFAHLIADPQCSRGIAEFYSGGLTGETGGVLCGMAAYGLHWLCGSVISYILLVIAGVLTLLGGMELTIPSILSLIHI